MPGKCIFMCLENSQRADYESKYPSICFTPDVFKALYPLNFTVTFRATKDVYFSWKQTATPMSEISCEPEHTPVGDPNLSRAFIYQCSKRQRAEILNN